MLPPNKTKAFSLSLFDVFVTLLHVKSLIKRKKKLALVFTC
jgi:hypothetical protein